VGLIKVDTLWPFPEDKIRKIARDVSLVIVPEMNVGRYSREIQRALPDKTVVSMGKPGGELHTPHEILDRILEEVGVHEPAL
jgi:2-oxoglutarate ferredoxin oxidoreductase subunit alpha